MSTYTAYTVSQRVNELLEAAGAETVSSQQIYNATQKLRTKRPDGRIDQVDAVAFIERYVTNRLVGGGKRNASALSELRAATSITSQDEEPEDTDSIELEDGDVHTWETEGGLVTT